MLPPPSVLTCWVQVEESSLLGARLLRKHEKKVALQEEICNNVCRGTGTSLRAS